MNALFRIGVLVIAFTMGHGQAQGQLLKVHLQHRVFMNWGYNRAQYSVSNIHFTGQDYDFILHDVAAVDLPEELLARVYLSPSNITRPQYNYRVGWFLNDHWSFSLGLDHMKYVVISDQTVGITGTISEERSQKYAGTEAHSIQLTPDFLQYEHTDGLNLLSVDADHYDPIWQSMNGKHALFLSEGAFIGPVIPRSDVRLFGEGLNNDFHLAGYGAGVQLGAFAVFWDRVFARAAVRGGYIQLPDVLTTGAGKDRAAQSFWFVEEYLVLGVLIGKR